MGKKIINNLTSLLFFIIFGIITYQNSLVLEFSLLQIRELDDLALLNSIIKLKNFIYEGNLRFIFSFANYSYGFFFWILNTIFLAPLTLFNNDSIVIFAARQITAIFAFGCVYLVIRVSKTFGACKVTANIIGLFFILTPNFFIWSMRFHVNFYCLFFGLLALFILLKSKKNIKKNIIYSSFFFGVSVGTKLTGILIYPLLIYILIYKTSLLKTSNKIYLLFIFNIIFLFSFIISFCPVLFLSPFYLEEAKLILNMSIKFKNLGNSLIYLDRTLLFKESMKFYYGIIIFIILVLFGAWWSFKEYSRYKNTIPLFLLINILVGFIVVTFHFNKSSIYISAYTISICSLLPVLLCGLKFFNKEVTKFFSLFFLIILQVFLNFDFLQAESLRHYRLIKTDEYANTKKALKDMEILIDQNLLKKNNAILMDFNAIFPNGIALQRYFILNYLNAQSNLEIFKKYDLDYAYIVLNKTNASGFITEKRYISELFNDPKFEGYETEFKNRELLAKTGFFKGNKGYKLIYSNYNYELYEILNFN
jgi:hypothetical protein